MLNHSDSGVRWERAGLRGSLSQTRSLARSGFSRVFSPALCWGRRGGGGGRTAELRVRVADLISGRLRWSRPWLPAGLWDHLGWVGLGLRVAGTRWAQPRGWRAPSLSPFWAPFGHSTPQMWFLGFFLDSQTMGPKGVWGTAGTPLMQLDRPRSSVQVNFPFRFCFLRAGAGGGRFMALLSSRDAREAPSEKTNRFPGCPPPPHRPRERCSSPSLAPWAAGRQDRPPKAGPHARDLGFFLFPPTSWSSPKRFPPRAERGPTSSTANSG